VTPLVWVTAVDTFFLGGEPAIVVEDAKKLTYLVCQAAELEHAMICQTSTPRSV
jgi:hypothetical protein